MTALPSYPVSKVGPGLVNITCSHDYVILGHIIASIRCEQLRQVIMSVFVLQNLENTEFFGPIFQRLV